MKKQWSFLIIFGALLSFLLTGCSTTTKKSHGVKRTKKWGGGYYLDDGPMDEEPANLLDVPDAVPRVEPIKTGPSKPYSVFGKTYVPMTQLQPYKQRGRASWYGKKFHGKKTSSGESYDMFKMTAAHPTLPIPSYARVTSLANGNQVIVRVNDRGPFLSNRIIDLSYTAALKLDYIKQGSGDVEVELLMPEEIDRINNRKLQSVVEKPKVLPQTQTIATTQSGFYLQMGAYQESFNAKARQDKIEMQWPGVVRQMRIVQDGTMYKLLAGPYLTREEAQQALEEIKLRGLTAFVVKR